MQPLQPPASRLPAGASAWVLLEDLAKKLRKDVRTLKLWCERRLVHFDDLAGGVGGRWIAVTDGYWPISNPEGVAAYRKHRSAAARVGGLKGAQASVAARASKRKAPRSGPSSPRRSA